MRKLWYRHNKWHDESENYSQLLLNHFLNYKPKRLVY